MSNPHPHPHPSSFIQDELDARGWTVADLANRMGFESCVSNKLSMDMYFIIGPNDTRMRIGNDTANKLSKAFDISPEFFLNLEAAWLRDAERKAREFDMSDWQGNIAAFMQSECDAILGPYGAEYTQEPAVVYFVAIAHIEALTAQLAERDAALKAADDLAAISQALCDGYGFASDGGDNYREVRTADIAALENAVPAYRKARGQDDNAR